VTTASRARGPRGRESVKTLTGCANRWVRGGGEGRVGALSPGRAAPAAEACPPRSMSRPSHARRVVMVADQPLDPVGEGGVVADEPIGAVGGERKGHLVPADVDVRMVACGLGGVGHWVDEPGRRPEVVVDEGLGDDVSPVRCQAAAPAGSG
jgi:hypothetical protein